MSKTNTSGSRPFSMMRGVLFVVLSLCLWAGCRPSPEEQFAEQRVEERAAAKNRMVLEKIMAHLEKQPLLDENYLTNVYVPSHTNDQVALSNSVRRLEEHLAECRSFMHQVVSGKIPVDRVKSGWLSSAKNGDYLLSAVYYSDLGTLLQFEKNKIRDTSLVYGFRFSTNGSINLAFGVYENFGFDEHGRVEKSWHDPQ